MKDKQKEIINLINENEEIFEGSFLKRSPTEEEIKKAEMSLGFQIPDSYLWFLNEFDHGGFFFEFLGYGLNGVALFVEKTLYEREFGLPKMLLVIEDLDEYVNCIDTISNKIVSWSKHDRDDIIDVADNFYEHFIDNINNAIDNY